MSRRQFLAASIAASAAAIMIASQRPARADDTAAMVAFVRGVYTREIARHLNRRSDDGTFAATFTVAMRELMNAPRKAASNEPLGIVHAFFGPGVLPGTEIALANVAAVAGSQPRVRVDLVYRGESRSVLVSPARESGEWRISDVSYGNGESLVARYRRMTGL